jgi:hypothetical protein
MPKNNADLCTAYPLSTFFPRQESSDPSQPNEAETRALSICARCPLARLTACLNRELHFPHYQQNGVVGGTTAAQRKSILGYRSAARSAELAA